MLHTHACLVKQQPCPVYGCPWCVLVEKAPRTVALPTSMSSHALACCLAPVTQQPDVLRQQTSAHAARQD
eukprot:116710-Alexandrium_andersonii.AAC.1